MCGKFTLAKSLIELKKAFPQVIFDEELPANYNFSPTNQVWAVLGQGLAPLSWGISPAWDREKRLINARAEGLSEKPSFAELYQQNRCLILADGFYEWKQEAKIRTPYYFSLMGGRPFAFAGLWQEWQGQRQCTVITVKANEQVSPIHDRMPAILEGEASQAWLAEPRGELLSPFDAKEMQSWQVGRGVSKRGAQGQSLILPIEDEQLRF